MSSDYVDDRTLFARTQIARVTWQNWRAKGEGPPFYRLGRRCLYRWAEVDAWIQARRTGGPAPGEQPVNSPSARS